MRKLWVKRMETISLFPRLGGIFHLMLKLTELLITRWAEITARYDVRSNEKWNRPFAAKPSRGLLFIKLWAATLRMPKMEKACRKH